LPACGTAAYATTKQFNVILTGVSLVIHEMQTMERIAAFMEANRAQLWINHDKAQSAGIPKAPAYVE
jgi:hypothetical protein